MPDITSRLLPALKSHRLEGLDTGAFILPKYEGGSILNIPDSICHFLGLPGLGPGPLDPEILHAIDSGQEAKSDLHRVIFVLMDALSLERMQRWTAAGELPVWEALLRDGLFAPLTSIVPSTTTAPM